MILAARVQPLIVQTFTRRVTTGSLHFVIAEMFTHMAPFRLPVYYVGSSWTTRATVYLLRCVFHFIALYVALHVVPCRLVYSGHHR